MAELAITPISNEVNDYITSKYLNSLSGRTALAASMANPIRRSLDYQGIGRRLLVVDQLPQGALPIYDKDINVPASRISMRGRVPDRILEGERVMVPTFPIASYPQVTWMQQKERRFNIIDRAQQKAKSEIQAAEDNEIFTAFEVASDPALAGVNDPTLAPTGLTKAALASAAAEIEKWDLWVRSIIMHATSYAQIKTFGRDDFDPVTQREILQTGLFGKLWGANIYVSKLCPVNKVYLCAEREFVGVMPIRQDITVIPADMPWFMRLGWVIYEEIGIGVVNPRGVSQIVIG